MVLVHSDFSDENAVALDSLRTWAKEKFSRDKHYLHPMSVHVDERQNTVFSAFFVNLFGPERGLLDRAIKQFLGWEPSIRLRDGMAKTYSWIENEMLDSAKYNRGRLAVSAD